MADWIEDDWDSSSPVGSPSSSLPQSIREVLESVRAECRTGKFGAYCIDKPTAITETSSLNEEKLKSDDELTLEVVDAKEVMVKPYGKTPVNSDKSQDRSLSEHVTSQKIQGRATREIPKVTQPIQSNFDTLKVDTTSPQLNVVKKERNHQKDVKEEKNALSLDGIGKGLKPSPVLDRKISRNLIAEDLLRLKKENCAMVGGSHAEYWKTKVARWIRIDSPNKNLSPSRPLARETQIENPHEIMIQDGPKRKASIQNETTAKNDIRAAHCATNKVDPYMETAPENHHVDATKPEVQVIYSVDLTDYSEAPKISETTLKKRKEDKISLTVLGKGWAAENSNMVEKNTQKPDQIIKECLPIQKRVAQSFETVDLSSDEDEGQKRVYVNASSVELSDNSQNAEHKPEEVVDQTSVQGKSVKPEEHDTNDMDEMLADDWMILEKRNVVDRRTLPNVKSKKRWSSDDSENSSMSWLTHGLPRAIQRENKQRNGSKVHAFKYNSYYHQDVENMEWADTQSNTSTVQNESGIDEKDMDIADYDYGDEGDESDDENRIDKIFQREQPTNDENRIDKIFQREQPTNDETLHNKLKEKYRNMHFLNEMAPTVKKYCEYKPVVHEEIEGFARACDEPPTQEAKKIKIRALNDEKVFNKNAIQSNSNSGGGRKNSVTVWRQELLSSDFNLIYGSLRAILMRNISKDARHRLIQTMIATMSEIEEVTMGGGIPTQQSVRCETPEPSPEFVEFEEDEKESDSDKSEEIQKETSPSRLPVYDEEIRTEWAIYTKQNLRGRETALNLRRMKELMRVCSDGNLECLICKKTGLPVGRACRACSAMVYRIERNYTIGAPLPVCKHANYSGGAQCKSCRFRQFSFLSMTATDTRVRQVNIKTCPVCNVPSYYIRGWKCSKCYYFLLRLTRTKGPVPTCEHHGEYPANCEGCRCYNLQEEWPNHEIYREYPLPLVKKEHNKREM